MEAAIQKIRVGILIITAISLALVFMACKSEEDDGVVSTLNNPSNSSMSGCRGREAGINRGPTDLYLPYPNGRSYTVSQTWFGNWSHYFTGGEHAIDFLMADGSDDIAAAAQGKVMAVKEDSNKTCTSNCPDANYVLVDHGGGFYSKYFHFCQNCVDVTVGQEIGRGTVLGKAGNTGWSTEPHLHFEVVDWEENCTVTYDFIENDSTTDDITKASSVGNSYMSQNSSQGISGYVPSKIGGTVYKDVGILIDPSSDFSWVMTRGSTLQVKGSLTAEAQSAGANGVIVFLIDKTTFQVIDASPDLPMTETGVDSTFDFEVTVPNVPTGNYLLGISKLQNNQYWWNNAPIVYITAPQP